MLLRRMAAPALKQEQRVAAQVAARPSGLCSTLTIWRLCLGLLLPFTLALGYCSQIWVSKFMQAKPVTVIESVQSSTAMVTSESDSRRVAVCFFGLTRSLNHTIASIKENVIGPLVQQGYEADVFVHTYNDIRHLINTRTGEDTDLDTEQWRLLQPYDVSLTSQEDFLQSVDRKMRRCLQRGTGWPREALDVQVSNVRNLLAQLNSVLQVGKLWERKHSERKYSAVLFARPDVNFTCPFPAHMLDNLQDETVYAPDFALWRGINDRFALLRPAAAAVWKRRVFFSLHACRFRPIHAEIFASDFAAATGLSYLPIKRFGFVRMRSTGVVAALDETYPDLCAGGASSRHA